VLPKLSPPELDVEPEDPLPVVAAVPPRETRDVAELIADERLVVVRAVDWTV
jgi:hypothetical protein